jgi:hypothetical protein
MALLRLEVPPTEGPLPARVVDFVRVANDRIDRFCARRVKHPINAFVPSDLELTWRTLDAIAQSGIAPGRAFCEWGCGFGAIAGLATFAGFDAAGIEIERDLVDEAKRLAADFALKIDLVHGNFVPAGAGTLADCDGNFTWLSEAGPDGHSALELEPDDFDLVFAFPWPGEEEVIFRLFDAFAAPEALLLTFHGREGLRVDRKTSSRVRRRR